MSDRRSSSRLEQPVEVQFWCDSTHHQGRIEDLSAGGFYVYSVLDWPVGQSLEFSFSLPGSTEPIRGSGTVVWAEYMGFGVRFDSLDKEAKKRIRALLQTVPMADRRGGRSLDERLAAAG